MLPEEAVGDIMQQGGGNAMAKAIAEIAGTKQRSVATCAVSCAKVRPLPPIQRSHACRNWQQKPTLRWLVRRFPLQRAVHARFSRSHVKDLRSAGKLHCGSFAGSCSLVLAPDDGTGHRIAWIPHLSRSTAWHGWRSTEAITSARSFGAACGRLGLKLTRCGQSTRANCAMREITLPAGAKRMFRESQLLKGMVARFRSLKRARIKREGYFEVCAEEQ